MLDPYSRLKPLLQAAICYQTGWSSDHYLTLPDFQRHGPQFFARAGSRHALATLYFIDRAV